MSESALGDDAYKVVIRDYGESVLGKSLQNEIKIACKDYSIFCKVVDAIKGVLNE